MKRAFLVATGLLAMSTSAHAGGYIGLAIGTVPSINDDFASATAAPSGRSLRLLGGARVATLPFGSFSVEAALNGFPTVTEHFGDQTDYQLSAALKYSLPLGNDFEAFGRAGIEHSWLGRDDDRYDLSGTGFLVGAGIELRLSSLLAGSSLARSSVFVDYNIHHVGLSDPRGTLEQTTGMFGLGATFGF